MGCLDSLMGIPPGWKLTLEGENMILTKKMDSSRTENVEKAYRELIEFEKDIVVHYTCDEILGDGFIGKKYIFR